jgi:aryl-alcohol dehydrogenase-like predicted oxidoreductase
MTARLALGTVQFGLNYGVSNTTGMVNEDNIRDILETARAGGITVIDTAAGYGDAENILGHNDLSGFNIITKFSVMGDERETTRTNVLDEIKGAIDRLKLEKLDGILLHRVQDLGSKAAPQIYEAMQLAKQIGLVNKIGYSVYHPENCDVYFDDFPPDIVQLPANAFDQRFKNSGWLDKLQNANVDIHIRSVFLQGLLLMQDIDTPSYFDPWHSLLESWRAHCQVSFNSPIEACLAPFKELSAHHKLVVGVQSDAQLNTIIAAMKLPPPTSLPDFSLNDVSLIDPSLWPAK